MANRKGDDIAAPPDDKLSEDMDGANLKGDDIAAPLDDKFSEDMDGANPKVDNLASLLDYKLAEDMDGEAPEEVAGEIDAQGRAVHIVHLMRPEEEDPEAFDIKTLASVIGSEEAAKEAVIYHYTVAASGFAARLTPEQVAHLSEKPEVLVVVRDRVCQLR